jgi:S1-C subfamily serine protease
VFARTKVQPEDIITAVNGVRITNSAEFFESMYTCKPQDKAEFTLYRPSDKSTFTVTVALLGQYE